MPALEDYRDSGTTIQYGFAWFTINLDISGNGWANQLLWQTLWTL